MYFIVATHGEMAKGVYDASRILSGKRDNFTFIEAYIESDDFAGEFEKILSGIHDDNIIVLTDLLQGSVNQVVLKYQKERKLEIIAGINLSLVLKVLSIDDGADIVAQLRNCVKDAREQLILINDLLDV